MNILPKVLVIIINFKTSHLIRDVLKSIEEDDVAVTVLVLDNGSTNSTFSELEQIDDDRLILLASKENLGFTGGVNYVLKYANANLSKFEFFFLLNPDALSCKNLISQLLADLTSDEKNAVISPKIVYPEGKIWYAGAMIDFSKGKVLNLATSNATNNGSVQQIDVYSGCAALFKMEKIEDVGFFDESLFMYYDEAELSLRLREKQYKVVYTPALQVIHNVSYTTRNTTHIKTYYMTRNKFVVFGTRMTLLNKYRYVIHELGYHFKRGRFRNAFYLLRALMDYKQGKLGEVR